jgi:site-specific DNA-methyltransferase (adenine-specific)
MYPLPRVYFDNLRRCAELVMEGGILFVYGVPYELPYYGSYLSTLTHGDFRFIFKYWIVLNVDTKERTETLQPAHQGLLLYVKSKSSDRTSNGFHLTTSGCRVPHSYCSYCGRNLRDWGGKKHFMNPAGSALSDVWSDLEHQAITDNRLPQVVEERIMLLTEEKAKVLIVREATDKSGEFARVDSSLQVLLQQKAFTSVSEPTLERTHMGSVAIEWNEVYQEDCVSFMRQLLNIYPDGVFDLVFADPPYNLEKEYEEYSDDKLAADYLQWCNEWLRLCVGVLKPGGTLMVLNLPKWAVYHALFLHSMLDFRHWICWDAMADPRGKLLPAHYALLYYTKPGSKIKFRYEQNTSNTSADYVEPPDSPEYCLRQSCVRARKKSMVDHRVMLSDVWFNIHRIKHGRDRDYHPCQLPEKLLDRIIRLTTDPGDKVFDPFAGVGTTAVVAQRLGRDFITCEIDPRYVQIANDKLQRSRYETDLFGAPLVRRASKAKRTSIYTKKDVETTLQSMALRLGRVPTLEEIREQEPWILDAIEELYDEGIRRPLKAAKLALRIAKY